MTLLIIAMNLNRLAFAKTNSSAPSWMKKNRSLSGCSVSSLCNSEGRTRWWQGKILQRLHCCPVFWETALSLPIRLPCSRPESRLCKRLPFWLMPLSRVRLPFFSWWLVTISMKRRENCHVEKNPWINSRSIIAMAFRLLGTHATFRSDCHDHLLFNCILRNLWKLQTYFSWAVRVPSPKEATCLFLLWAKRSCVRLKHTPPYSWAHVWEILGTTSFTVPSGIPCTATL